MKTCRELLNEYFITTKGYNPENRFLPSNEQLFIYDKLATQLKEAEKVIDFYARAENWYNTDKDEFLEICDSDKRVPFTTTLKCGGKKAREYKEKYKFL